MLLEVQDMRVKYGAAEALKGISFKVPEGGIVCLVGSNGAGKTTTLKAICGAKRLSGGQVLFAGQRIDGIPPHHVVKRGIVHVPEGRRLFPEMTVRENLEMGSYLDWDGRGRRGRMDEVLSLFPRLKERLKQHAGSLSGGEQQMLAVGRALMGAPRLLLMDEPTLGMSPLLCQAVSDWLVEINKQGITILLAEQNAEIALHISHHGYVLETGDIVLHGETQELLANQQVQAAYLGG